MDWAKATERRVEKNFRLRIWCDLYWRIYDKLVFHIPMLFWLCPHPHPVNVATGCQERPERDTATPDHFWWAHLYHKYWMTGPVADNTMTTVCVKWWKSGNYMADVQLLEAVRHLHWACKLCTENNPESNGFGANMGAPRADRTQVGPMLVTWTLLSGNIKINAPLCNAGERTTETPLSYHHTIVSKAHNPTYQDLLICRFETLHFIKT